jgi:hypothetical protein
MNTLCDSDTNYYFYNKKNIYKAPTFLDIPTPYIYPLPHHPLDMSDMRISTAYLYVFIGVFYIHRNILFGYISNFHLINCHDAVSQAQKSPRFRRLVVVTGAIAMGA